MKKILIFVCILLCIYSLQGQRYIKGMKGVHVEGGLCEGKGFNLSLGFSQYTKHTNRWVSSVDYLHRTYITPDSYKIPLQQFTVCGGYYLKLFEDRRKTFFFSVGANLILGYESVNNNKYRLSDGSVLENKGAWLYGGNFALEVEYYATDTYVLLLSVKERITGGSKVSLFHTTFNLGLKIILNDGGY